MTLPSKSVCWTSFLWFSSIFIIFFKLLSRLSLQIFPGAPLMKEADMFAPIASLTNQQAKQENIQSCLKHILPAITLCNTEKQSYFFSSSDDVRKTRLYNFHIKSIENKELSNRPVGSVLQTSDTGLYTHGVLSPSNVCSCSSHVL